MFVLRTILTQFLKISNSYFSDFADWYIILLVTSALIGGSLIIIKKLKLGGLIYSPNETW